MDFGELYRATLIQRYKRFLADCRLDNGETITTTCPNTGALLGCCDPGSTIWLSKSDKPTRKYAYTWELTERPGLGLTGINTSRPNALVEEAIKDGKIPGLLGYTSIRREVKYGINSRIDLLLEASEKPNCYVEVKNVTFMRQPGVAEFPDCKTERGTKHLIEMSAMVRQGHRAVMVYLIQNASPDRFTLAGDLDPVYAKTYAEARKAGVEAIALTSEITHSHITVRRQIPVTT